MSMSFDSIRIISKGSRVFLWILFGIPLFPLGAEAGLPANTGSMKKVADIVIYRDRQYYAAFPSLVVRPNGEILCAFRRAPDRRALWNAPATAHTDANSYCVLVRSNDGARTWTQEPELIYAHPLGGSQDPCMVQLRDGTIFCSSYAWALIPAGSLDHLPPRIHKNSSYAVLGGYVMLSENGGRTWSGPFLPMALPGDRALDALASPLPAHNRGAAIERRNGNLDWAVVRTDKDDLSALSVHLVTSGDCGKTWRYLCPVAEDATVSFNETSLIETDKGDLIAFMRTEGFGGRAAYARSSDGGKTFEKWKDGGFIGHPFHALKLKDGRIILVYGYRQSPFGIRARLLNPDCSDIESAPEIVLRQDGGNWDIGYPWAALLADGRILVAYYFNINDGTRYIAGTLIRVDGKR